LTGHLAGELRGPPRVLSASGHSFSDLPRQVVSIVNLASIRAIARATGAPLSPLRFRANLYVDGWPEWHEFALLGREIAVGPSARAKPIERIGRCAATEVDPETGESDVSILQTMRRGFGHSDCGLYCEVTAGGDVRAGDPVTIA